MSVWRLAFAPAKTGALRGAMSTRPILFAAVMTVFWAGLWPALCGCSQLPDISRYLAGTELAALLCATARLVDLLHSRPGLAAPRTSAQFC